MSNAMNILNDDEKKYFDTRGEHEPDGYSKDSSESIEPSEPESESRSTQPSDGIDGAISEGDGGQEGAGLEANTAEDDEPEQPPRKKRGERDFQKAYGIAESKRQEVAAQNKLLQQQLQMLMQQQNQQQQVKSAPREDIPDPNEDPLGYQAYQLEHLNKTVRAQQEYLDKQAKAYQQQQAINQFDNAYKQAAMEYSQEVTDFSQAYQFLEKSRITEYMAAGYSKYEAAQLLQEDERALAAKAFKDGVNPAERVYALARARGFNSAQNESKLEKVTKGLEKGKSLPRAGGKNMEKAYDISRIDEMSEEEFDKFFNQVKTESKRNGDYRKDFY